jgi:hypothetical protein
MRSASHTDFSEYLQYHLFGIGIKKIHVPFDPKFCAADRRKEDGEVMVHNVVQRILIPDNVLLHQV